MGREIFGERGEGGERRKGEIDVRGREGGGRIKKKGRDGC